MWALLPIKLGRTFFMLLLLKTYFVQLEVEFKINLNSSNLNGTVIQQIICKKYHTNTDRTIEMVVDIFKEK